MRRDGHHLSAWTFSSRPVLMCRKTIATLSEGCTPHQRISRHSSGWAEMRVSRRIRKG